MTEVNPFLSVHRIDLADTTTLTSFDSSSSSSSSSLPPSWLSSSPSSPPSSSSSSSYGASMIASLDSLERVMLRALEDGNLLIREFWSRASWSKRFAELAYEHSIYITCLLQLLLVFLFEVIDPSVLRSTSTGPTSSMFPIVLIIQLCQLVFIIAAHVSMFAELAELFVRPRKVWNMYVATCLSFTALYFTFFVFNRDSFVVDGYSPTDTSDITQISGPSDTETSSQVTVIYIFFIYFSAAIMTSTGFGDIAPKLWFSEACCNIQMLTGTLYHVGIFGLMLQHFRTFQRMRERVNQLHDQILERNRLQEEHHHLVVKARKLKHLRMMQQAHLQQHAGSSIPTNSTTVFTTITTAVVPVKDVTPASSSVISRSLTQVLPPSLRQLPRTIARLPAAVVDSASSRVDRCLEVLSQPLPPFHQLVPPRLKLWWRTSRFAPIFRRLAITYLLPISLCLQGIVVLLVMSIPQPFDSVLTLSGTAYTRKIAIITVSTLVQLVQFIFVFYTSLRLVQRVRDSDITLSFLIQSYLATALLYAGIYFVLFASISNHQFYRADAFQLSPFEVMYVFIHFSCTVITTTGFGDVYARGVISRLTVLSEMWVSILYSCIIIGLGTAQLIDIRSAEAEQHFQNQVKLAQLNVHHQLQEQDDDKTNKRTRMTEDTEEEETDEAEERATMGKTENSTEEADEEEDEEAERRAEDNVDVDEFVEEQDELDLSVVESESDEHALP